MIQKLKTIDDYLDEFRRRFEYSSMKMRHEDECVVFLKQAMESLVDSAPDREIRVLDDPKIFYQVVHWKKQMKNETD